MVLLTSAHDDGLQRKLLKLSSFYAISIGMTSQYHDQNSGEIKRSRLTSVTALLANILSIIVLPLIVHDVVKEVDASKLNLLMVRSNFVNMAGRGLAVLFIICSRSRRQQNEREYAERLFDIKTRISEIGSQINLPQQRANREFEDSLQDMIRRKVYLLVYQSLATCLSCVNASGGLWRKLFWLLAFMNIFNQLSLLLFMNFVALSHLCRGFHDINVQLLGVRELFAKCSVPEAWLCTLLRQQQRLHWQLALGVRDLIDKSRHQLLAARLTTVMSHVTMGYFGIIFSYQIGVHFVLIAFGALGYMLVFYDCYLNDALCDLTVTQHNETGAILRGFSHLEFGLTFSLPRICEQFSLQVASCSLQVNLCRLFAIDKSFFFEMFAHIVAFTIVLLQFHAYLDGRKEI